jgi:hypothetical protein
MNLTPEAESKEATPPTMHALAIRELPEITALTLGVRSTDDSPDGIGMT